MRNATRIPFGVFLVSMLSLSASAKTIVLDANDSDRMAGIAKAAPRQSWAMHAQAGEPGSTVFLSSSVSLTAANSFLIRFSLDKIPKSQRIAHAELILPITSAEGAEPRLYLWRILSEWGAGVCHLYRFAQTNKVAWTRQGGRGISSDRAVRPTDIVRLTKPADIAINVTEDVELWYGSAVPNNGWMLSVEDPGVTVRLRSPTWDGQMAWKLRITYEPEGTE